MDASTKPLARLRLPDGEFLLYPDQPVRLGRSADNDIVLENPKISRSHARVTWNGSKFLLEDLGSINGTFLNLTRLEGTTQELCHGDQIGLSRLVLVFELLDPQPAADELPKELPEMATDEPPIEHPATAEKLPAGPMLVIIDGLDLGREYPLWGETITIGRDCREATWEIRLTDRSVSRRHARLELSEEGGYILVDLGSVNGTRLNGRPVKESTLLRDGDEIGIGMTRLVLHY